MASPSTAQRPPSLRGWELQTRGSQGLGYEVQGFATPLRPGEKVKVVALGTAS